MNWFLTSHEMGVMMLLVMLKETHVRWTQGLGLTSLFWRAQEHADSALKLLEHTKCEKASLCCGIAKKKCICGIVLHR